jgi:hypothetical protein
MKNMSFQLTTNQARTMKKDVTRRNGWPHLRSGEFIQQIVKGMGLKKGESVERIHVIKTVSVSREPLVNIVTIPHRDKHPLSEVEREGFPGRSADWFVEMYCKHNKCEPSDLVTRIEFRYVFVCQGCGETSILPAYCKPVCVGCGEMLVD